MNCFKTTNNSYSSNFQITQFSESKKFVFTNEKEIAEGFCSKLENFHQKSIRQISKKNSVEYKMCYSFYHKI